MKINTAWLGATAAIGRDTVSQALWIGTFTVLTAIGAEIHIPWQPVPYTLQTFFVCSLVLCSGSEMALSARSSILASAR